MRAQTDERKGPRPTKVKVVYFCQVDGCKAKLSTCKPYSQRYRVCPAHLGAHCVELQGVSSRFCQQCGKFHTLDEFDGTKRSCRARLQHHNNSRQQRRKEAALQQSIKTAVLLQQHGTRQAVKQHKTIPCTSNGSDSPAAGTSSCSGKKAGSSNSICTSTTTALERRGSLTSEYASSPVTCDEQQLPQHQQEDASADEDGGDMDAQEEYDADVDLDAAPSAGGLGGYAADTTERSGSDVSYQHLQQQQQQQQQQKEKVVDVVTSSIFQPLRPPGTDPDMISLAATVTDMHPIPAAAAAAAARHQATRNPAEPHSTDWVHDYPALESRYSMSLLDGAAAAAATPISVAAAPENLAEVSGFGIRYFTRCTVPGCVDCARGITTVRYCNVPGCTDCPLPPPHIRAAILQQQQQGWSISNSGMTPAAAPGVGKAPPSVPETLLPEQLQQQQGSSLYGRYRSLSIADLSQGTAGSTLEHSTQYNQLQSSHSSDPAQIGSYCSPHAAATAVSRPAAAAAAAQGPMLRTYSDHLSTHKMSPSVSSTSMFAPVIRSSSFTPASGSCSPAAAAKLPSPATVAGGNACCAITAGSASSVATLGRGGTDRYATQGIWPVAQQQQDDGAVLYSRSLDSPAWPTAAFPGAAAVDAPQQQIGTSSSRGVAAMMLTRQLSLPSRPGAYAVRSAGQYHSNNLADLAPDRPGSDLTYNPMNAAGFDPRSDLNGFDSNLGISKQANPSGLGSRADIPQAQFSPSVNIPGLAAAARAAVGGDLATMHSEDDSSFQVTAPAAVSGRAILHGVPEKESTAPGRAVSVETTTAYSSSVCSQQPAAAATAVEEVSISRVARPQNWFNATMSAEMTLTAAAATGFEPAEYYQVKDSDRPMLLDLPTQREQQRVPLQLPRLLSRETVARSSPSGDLPGSFSDSAATAATVAFSELGDLAAVGGYQQGPPAFSSAGAAAGCRQTAASATAAALQQAYVNSLAATAAAIYVKSESAIPPPAAAAATTLAGAAVPPLFSAAGAIARQPVQPSLPPMAVPNPLAPGLVLTDHEVPGSNLADPKDSGKVLEEYFSQWLTEDDDIPMEDILDPMLSVESIASGNVHETLDELLRSVQ